MHEERRKEARGPFTVANEREVDVEWDPTRSLQSRFDESVIRASRGTLNERPECRHRQNDFAPVTADPGDPEPLAGTWTTVRLVPAME